MPGKLSFVGEFKLNFLRHRALRIVADVLVKCIAQFTPGGLEAAMKDGWSVVGFLQGLAPDELNQLTLNIPSVKASQGYAQNIAMGYMSNPEATKGMGKEVASRITARDITAEVIKRLPEHGKTLKAHPEWVERELSKAKSLLG